MFASNALQRYDNFLKLPYLKALFLNESYNLTFIHRGESLVLLVTDDAICFDVDVFTWI